MRDSDIIRVDNDFQRKVFDDFLSNLIVQTFLNTVEIKREIDPTFDGEKFKREVINNWFSLQSNLINGMVGAYNDQYHGAAEVVPPEDVQASATMDLTRVKELINSLIL